MRSSASSIPIESRMMILRDARLDLLLAGELLVRRRRRVDDERLGVAHVGEEREELERVDELDRSFAAALDAEGEHRARTLGRYFCARA